MFGWIHSHNILIHLSLRGVLLCTVWAQEAVDYSGLSCSRPGLNTVESLKQRSSQCNRFVPGGQGPGTGDLCCPFIMRLNH